MIKEVKRYTVMALAALMLVGGISVAANKWKSVVPKKTMADITETMPDTGSDEIVAGEEEVPL